MKWIAAAIIAAALGLITVCSSAQMPSPPPANPIPYAPSASVSVSAHEIGSGKGVERSYSNYVQDNYRSKGLEVEVRNISKYPGGEIKVTVCWVSKSADPQVKGISISHAETLPSTLGGVSSAKLQFWSPLIASSTTNFTERRYYGTKIDGWFVIVARQELVLSGVASSAAYQQLIHSPSRLQPLLKAYRPDGRVATSTMPHWRTDPIRDEWSARNDPQPSQTPFEDASNAR